MGTLVHTHDTVTHCCQVAVWAHLLECLTPHGSIGTLVSATVCPRDAMWQCRHALWRLLCARITRRQVSHLFTCLLFWATPVCTQAVSWHLHMMVRPRLFAYLLWYSTARDTMDSPGHTHPFLPHPWPHLFTPMPFHNATTQQHWLLLYESWSVSQHHPPVLAHLATCLPVSCHSHLSG